MINGGTTTLALARALRGQRDLTIATNNLLIAPALLPTSIRDLYMFGGAVHPLTLATVGPVTLRSSGGSDLDIRCDLGFIGWARCRPTPATPPAPYRGGGDDAGDDRRSSGVTILADLSKFDKRLFAQICELGAVDSLITDSGPPADLAQALSSAGVELLAPT